ncbi:SCAR3 protein, partial [Vireo altiloquus]|nr:SCAR3 protein [Vireo altiloquus]
VFRKVDSISAEISSSQNFYERKFLSLQEDLQGLGEKTRNGSECRDTLGRELSELQQDLEELQKILLLQEILLDRTSQSHARLSSAGSSISGGLENCSTSLGSIQQGLELLRERAQGWREVTSHLENSLELLARERSEAGAAAERLNSSLEQNSQRLQALQRRAEEEELALQKASGERQNLSRILGKLREASSWNSELLRSLRAGLGAAALEASRNSEGTHELGLELLALQLQLDNITSELEELRENIRDLLYRRGHRRNRSEEMLQELEFCLERQREELGSIQANVGATEGHIGAMLSFLGHVSSSCALGLGGHSRELLELHGSLGMLQEATEELRESFGMLGARLEFGVRNLSAAVEEMREVDLRHGEELRNASELRGFPGLPGPRGPRGDPGSGGAPGIRGRKGDAGILGSPGSPGAPGAPGPAGPHGERGPEGSRGIPGSKGSKGSLGIPGSRGPAGPQGDPGAPGTAGAAGKEGKAGMAGKTGNQGEPGERGAPGEPGEPGKAGLPGKAGEPGAPGKAGA